MKTIEITVDDARGFVRGESVVMQPGDEMFVVVATHGDTLKLRRLSRWELLVARAKRLWSRRTSL